MADPFVAEIRIVGFGFAPVGWAMCNGQLLPISQNTALFSLLGTTFGGNGTSNFALPNLQGSAPMEFGQGDGLTLRDLGETGGEQTVTLLQTEMPAHTHGAMANTGAADSPANNAWGSGLKGHEASIYAPFVPGTTPTVQMNSLALSIAGGSTPHDNMPPYLVLNFIIALQGVFPPRS
jgi:microcystin-dependent protein